MVDAVEHQGLPGGNISGVSPFGADVVAVGADQPGLLVGFLRRDQCSFRCVHQIDGSYTDMGQVGFAEMFTQLGKIVAQALANGFYLSHVVCLDQQGKFAAVKTIGFDGAGRIRLGLFPEQAGNLLQ